MAEMKHFNTSTSKKPLEINWGLLLDDSVDDRPPDIVITPAEKSKGRGGDLQKPEMEEEDPEYRMRTDGELERMIPEVERRKRNRIYKGGSGTRCKETLQLSDESDDGASYGKKKSDQKSSASPNFTKLFSQKLDEDKSSRTVNAFQGELSFFKPFQGSKMKQNCHQSSSRSKQFRCSTTLKPVAEILDDCMQDVIVYYPSRDDQDSVEVIYRDMTCLAPQAYLSSTIMNFYIRYLQQMTSSENMMGNYHFFNTYFYNKLQKLSYKEDSFLKFRKWWKGVNIFNKPYILLPVHDKAHWSLGIICFPSKENELGPIVLHLDSLGLHDSRSIFDNIRRFVKEEWRYLKNSEENLNLPITDEIWENFDRRMDDRRISVPQQRNDYDCGLFVLYYMECFIKEAPKRFKEKDLSMFGKQWFIPQEASNLRRRISNLLVQEFKIAKQKETISSPMSS